MHAQPSTRRPRLNERLRLWLERGRSGFHLRDAATGDPVRWEDPRILVVPVAGMSFRIESLDDRSFDPGRSLALVPEPENEHDPNAVAVWNEQRTVGMFLNGQEIAAPGPRGERVEDDSFLMLFNAHHEDVTFTLPTRRFGSSWELVLTTADPATEPGLLVAPARTEVPVIARSVMLLKRVS